MYIICIYIYIISMIRIYPWDTYGSLLNCSLLTIGSFNNFDPMFTPRQRLHQHAR